MPALTWRQVAAPDFSGTSLMYKTVADQLSRATASASEGLKDWQGARMATAEDQIAQQASKFTSPEAYRAALESGQILGSVDQGLIGRKLIEAAAGQESAIAAREKRAAQYEMPTIEGLFQQALLNKDEAALSSLAQENAKKLRLADSPFADPFKVQGMLETVKNNDARKSAPHIDNAIALAISQGAYDNAQALASGNQDQLQRAGSQNFSPIALQSSIDKHALSTLATAVADVTLPADKRKLIDPWLAKATPTQRQAFFAQNPEYNSSATLLASATPGVGDVIDSNGDLIKSGTGTVAASGANSTAPATTAIATAMGAGTSRADRNSNPGNLKAPEGTWIRKAPGFLGVDDGGFAKFDSPANGLAAMTTQLTRYREGTQATKGKPVKTVEGIIGIWSPTSDPKNAPGSTANYAKYVANKLGLNPGDEVPVDKMSAMAQAMYEFESGNKVPTKQEIADGGITAASTGDNKASQILANNIFNEVADIGPNDIAGAHKFLVTALGEGGADIISPVRFRELYKQYGRRETQASIAARAENPKLSPVTELVPAGEFAVSLLDSTSNTGGFFKHTKSMSGKFSDAIFGNFKPSSKWVDLPTLQDNVNRSGSAIPEVMNRNAAVAKATAQDVKDREDAVAKQRSQVAVYKTLLEGRTNDPKLKAAYEASVLRLNEMLVAAKERNTGNAARNSQ